MKKKTVFIGFALVSLLVLGACASPHVSKPKAVQFQSEEQSRTSQERSKAMKPPEKSSTASSTSQPYRDDLAEEMVNQFLEAYYTTTSSNQKVVQSQNFCTPEVQKQLNLVKSSRNTAFQSKIIKKTVYKNNDKQFLAVVEYSLYGNKVTPDVVQLSVQKVGDTYLISRFSLPLKK